jgi:DNA-directed RNA polymerase specialized sigma24 family protein
MAAAPHNNQADLELFRRDPRAFLVGYQDTLRIILRVYVQCGMFHPQEVDDALQTINEELLLRLPSIQAHFNGTASLRTYLDAIVRNICIDLCNARNRQPKVVPLDDFTAAPHTSMTDRHDIEHARLVFRAILKQFDYKLELPRLLFCLKVRYRLPLDPEDVLKWYPECSKGDLTRLLKSLQNRESLTEKEVSERITPILNKASGRQNSPDAILRWTRERIRDILDLLNGSPQTASFDEETLNILIEDFFSPFLLKNR